MDLPLRRVTAVVIGMMLFLVAILTWFSRDGTESIARAAPAKPYGEMTIQEFSGENNLKTDIRDHEWDLTATYATGGGAGGGSGKATFHPFAVTRSITPISPAIASAVAQGRHFPKVTVKIFKPGTVQVAATYVLTDVALSGLHESPGGGSTEVIEFVYNTIKWTQANNNMCWDVENNAGCPVT